MRIGNWRPTIKQLKRSLPLCIAATLLITLLTCCLTNHIEYIPFPEFPVLISIMKEPDGTISISRDDLVRLAEFKLKYETLKETYGYKEEKVK